MRILLLSLLPIGDTLFTTPGVRAVRQQYPDAHITAVVYPTNQGILQNNPDIDDILLWPTRQTWPGFVAVARLLLIIRGRRYDLGVQFCTYVEWVLHWGRIPRHGAMKLPRFWWILPWAGVKWRRKHAVEHYSDVVRLLGVAVDDTRLRIYPSDEERRKAERWLERYRVSPGEMLVGIHPGGEGLWGRKQWSVQGFAQVADGLFDRLGARIMLMGGKEDAPLAAEIASMTRAPVINATGQTTLGETAALVSRCHLFIGNDSSPLHIASAMGTKVVGIYGITDPRSYRPWVPGGREGRDYAVVRSSLSCGNQFSLVGGRTLMSWLSCLTCPALEAITPGQVLDAALGLLSAEREAAVR